MENQTKEGMLKYISDSIQKYGNFYTSELRLEGEPIVGGVGKLMVLGNYFYKTYCICEVWLSGGDEPILKGLAVLYEDVDIPYLENVKTAVDRWVEVKTK